MRAFRQVDVFSPLPLMGNPVAVVHDADGLAEEQMAAFARWTNLSETTFLLSPTTPGADYRLRIWTPGGELPFAGHPTLGSAHAWLEAGGVPGAADTLVQECGAGLVRVRRGERLAFVAPPLLRSGPVAADDLTRIAEALAIDESDIVDAAWIDNGPGWVGLLLRDADAVLAVRPDLARFGDLDVGVVGLYPGGGADPGSEGAAVEVRAFCPGLGVVEDPVTGSLNAGIAQWLAGSRLPTSYVASQGTAMGRRGRVHVSVEGEGPDREVWVGGDTRTSITGTVAI
ncbi:phenazine biosynthesis protein PhzF [Nocardioides psychrotolerans]|uniref:Phenazine biosynthesis protein PhzF family n=1 Tax=Nocardioides psychrotolerans TaxID=1005945 RepID=A0A1I3FK94_9ACTN|nr:PhzF family phenazine biosynthesis protein [Nocardioides psychrotolerans]GEP37179.1 phenazine biosynthesis protein PhzF [Nocardioides psychrotolerans]SFI11600.1 phenazine biosynthesis protein PhzF family [Nocardioides psychrotolerans]